MILITSLMLYYCYFMHFITVFFEFRRLLSRYTLAVTQQIRTYTGIVKYYIVRFITHTEKINNQ